MNVIYFSGSGNTKRCAELFAGATGGKAVSIESCQEASQTITEGAELALA